MRDLAWVMCSPGLLAQAQSPYRGEKVADAWCQQACQQHQAWLAQLDADPESLLHWLAQHETQRLGIYFESLLAFWLRHMPDVELLAQNLVVGQPGLHLGEFDMLFRDKRSDQVIHWEVAVKFYLRYGATAYQWPGPNPRDTLQNKLDKVFARQLLLSQQPQAQAVLQAKTGTAQVRSQAFIKGYLFYPYSSDWAHPAAIPAGVSDDHLKGWWCRHADINDMTAQRMRTHRWRVLPRREWLASQWQQSADALMDAVELYAYLTDYFAKHYQALLLVEFEQTDVGWCEVSRGFVVNDKWPGDAAGGA